MVFNTTFNNISVISWHVEETGVPGENYRPAASHYNVWKGNLRKNTCPETIKCLKPIFGVNLVQDWYFLQTPLSLKHAISV